MARWGMEALAQCRAPGTHARGWQRSIRGVKEARHPGRELGSFRNTPGGDYLPPRSVCRFDLTLSAKSTSWRIAFERDGLSGC
jgi:hypothetical protein